MSVAEMGDTERRSVADRDERSELAARMVQVLPMFGEWAKAIRDFETPHGKLGFRQASILYGMRHGQIGDGAASPGLLADHYGVQPSVITRVLVRLEAGGFITRQTDPSDGRAQTLHITELGVTISTYIEDLFVHEMLDSMAFVDDDQLDDLRASLAILQRIAFDLDARRRQHRLSLTQDSAI